jgi:hypothetical protein
VGDTLAVWDHHLEMRTDAFDQNQETWIRRLAFRSLPSEPIFAVLRRE